MFESLLLRSTVTASAPTGANASRDAANDYPTISSESYAFYEVFANGKKYDLYFADVTTDTAHPDYLGIYALGVAPHNAEPATAPTAASNTFFSWVGQFDLSDPNVVTGIPGVYVPQK